MAAFSSSLFDTDTSYLEDAQAYECSMLDQWPRSDNVFVQRTASNMRPGMGLEGLPVTRFVELCGCMLASCPDTAFTFALDLSAYRSDGVIAAHLLSTEQGSEAPLTADNAGFLPFALDWFAKERSAITVTISNQALFWAHIRNVRND